MALQDMFQSASSYQETPNEFYQGMSNFLPSLGKNFNDYRFWQGGAAAENQEIGGDGRFNDDAVWSQLAPELDQGGYSFGFTPTGKGGSLMDVMQNGQNVGQFRAQADDRWLDKVGPLLPLLAAGGIGALGGSSAGAAGAGAMADGAFLGEFGSMAGGGAGSGAAGIGGAAGSAGSLVPGIQSGLINPAIGESVGAMGAGTGAGAGMTGVGATNVIGNVAPMATPAPWAGGMATPNAIGGMGGAMASGGAPGFTLGQLSSGAAIGGAGLEQGMSASNYSDAAAGYGEPMSGADTGMFDSMLGLTGSPGFANAATQFASPIMNNPVFDELRKLKDMLGKPVAGKLTGGDLLKGGLALNNYRQNSKNLKNQQNSLAGMFGQNSPYAQQLKQQLERRDAAAGRRSQYGPREVELQAQLAKMAAGVAPSINQISQQRQQQRGALTNTAGMLLDKGLGSLFGG